MNESTLTNFYRIMVFIRFDIKNEENKDIVCILIQAFDGLINNKEMCDAIVKIMPDWKTQLRYEESEYYFIQKQIIEFAKTALYIMKESLATNAFEIAYDIADLLHVLPDIVLQKKTNQWNSYWKMYVDPFNKKWTGNAFKF